MSEDRNKHAFPNSATSEPGMFLRDWFAGLAMQAAFAGQGAQQVADRDGRYNETNWAEVVAANAYEMADAMMKAREVETYAGGIRQAAPVEPITCEFCGVTAHDCPMAVPPPQCPHMPF